jgi:hypothetical protein
MPARPASTALGGGRQASAVHAPAATLVPASGGVAALAMPDLLTVHRAGAHTAHYGARGGLVTGFRAAEVIRPASPVAQRSAIPAASTATGAAAGTPRGAMAGTPRGAMAGTPTAAAAVPNAAALARTATATAGAARAITALAPARGGNPLFAPQTTTPSTSGTNLARPAHYLPSPPPISIRRSPATTHGPAVPRSGSGAGGARRSLVESTAALFAADDAVAATVRRLQDGDQKAGDMPQNLPSGMEIVHPNEQKPSNVSELPVRPPDEGSAGASLPPIDELVDMVVERIEERVIDELERRGRRYVAGAF